MLETCRPMDIEARSFEIITELLGDRKLDPENAPVIKRAIHTTADFDYADNLVFSPHAVQAGAEALRSGCDIAVTDTQMAAGIIRPLSLPRRRGPLLHVRPDVVAAEAKSRGRDPRLGPRWRKPRSQKPPSSPSATRRRRWYRLMRSWRRELSLRPALPAHRRAGRLRERGRARS